MWGLEQTHPEERYLCHVGSEVMHFDTASPKHGHPSQKPTETVSRCIHDVLSAPFCVSISHLHQGISGASDGL